MTNNMIYRLKKEKATLEQLIIEAQNTSPNASVLHKALEPYFEKVDQMSSYQPIGRLRFDRLFLETELSENKALFTCYARFANLAEGLTI